MPYQHDNFRGPETFHRYLQEYYEEDKRLACSKGIDNLGAFLLEVSISATTHKDIYTRKNGHEAYTKLKMGGKTLKEYVESDLSMVTDLIAAQQSIGDISNFPVKYEKLWPSRVKKSPPVKRLDSKTKARLLLLKPVIPRSDVADEKPKEERRRMSPSCCFAFIR